MPKLIKLKTYSDSKGDLTVIEKLLPFEIKRIYYIYNCDGSKRGMHRHKETIQAVVPINGSLDFYCQLKDKTCLKFHLNSPNQCLIIRPEDYHWFDNFSKNTILLVMASKEYDESDYIFKKY